MSATKTWHCLPRRRKKSRKQRLGNRERGHIAVTAGMIPLFLGHERREWKKFTHYGYTCVWVFSYLGFVFLGVPLKRDTAFLGGETTVQSRDWETEKGETLQSRRRWLRFPRVLKRGEKRRKDTSKMFFSIRWFGWDTRGTLCCSLYSLHYAVCVCVPDIQKTLL